MLSVSNLASPSPTTLMICAILLRSLTLRFLKTEMQYLQTSNRNAAQRYRFYIHAKLDFFGPDLEEKEEIWKCLTCIAPWSEVPNRDALPSGEVSNGHYDSAIAVPVDWLHTSHTQASGDPSGYGCFDLGRELGVRLLVQWAVFSNRAKVDESAMHRCTILISCSHCALEGSHKMLC